MQKGRLNARWMLKKNGVGNIPKPPRIGHVPEGL